MNKTTKMQPPSVDVTGTKSEIPACPMNYPGFIFRTLREDGYKAEALLEGTGLTEHLFADPHFRTEFSAVRRFILNAIEHTSDPHIGARLAWRFEAHYIGPPAYAAISAATFYDALDVLNRFFCLTFPAIEFSFPRVTTGLTTGEAAIRLRPRLPFEGLEYFVASSALIVCNNLFKAILRTEHVATRVEVTISEPDGWSEVASELSRVPVRFEARENRLMFPVELLSRALPGADPINHPRLLALCEKFAMDTGYEVSPAIQVLTFLEAGQNLGAPLAKAAEALGYSERSLRRQLDRAGTSYRELMDQVRESRAREMLANTTRPIQAVAYDLGYDTPSNFARSFKRWTGVTPKAFRDAAKARGTPGQN